MTIDRARFIINPRSGINRNPARIRRWIQEIWGASGKQFEIVPTEYRGHGTELAREAVKQNIPLVVAVGGDGTINEVATALVATDSALGVVPAGSGNGFARNMQLPLNQRRAIEALLEPEFRLIDAGKINSHFFFNVAGLGLDAVISANFEQFGIRGPLPYFIVGVREFFRYQPEIVTLNVDGKQITHEPLLLSIANGPQYGNGAIIAPRAVPDDGLLDVCILQNLPSWKAVLNLPRLFNGTIDQLKDMVTFQASEVVIQRSREGYIHTDGDPHWDSDILKVEVFPRQLKIALAKNTL